MSIRNFKIKSFQKSKLSNLQFSQRKQQIMQYDYQKMQQTCCNLAEEVFDSQCYFEEDSINTPTDWQILNRVSSITTKSSRSYHKQRKPFNTTRSIQSTNKKFDNFFQVKPKENFTQQRTQSIFNQGIYFNKTQTRQQDKKVRQGLNSPKAGQNIQFSRKSTEDDRLIKSPPAYSQNKETDLKRQNTQRNIKTQLAVKASQKDLKFINSSNTSNSPDLYQSSKEEQVTQSNDLQEDIQNQLSLDYKLQAVQQDKNGLQFISPRLTLKRKIKHIQINRESHVNKLYHQQNDLTPKLYFQENTQELPSIETKTCLFREKNKELLNQMECKRDQQIVQKFLSVQSRRQSKIQQNKDQVKNDETRRRDEDGQRDQQKRLEKQINIEEKIRKVKDRQQVKQQFYLDLIKEQF